MIEQIPFGRTGHRSSRVIFGAATLFSGSQERAASLVETLLELGVNHIDTAARYGDSELLLAPSLLEYRDRFFLATKTGERTYEGARDGIDNSLKRLGVDHVDLIQFHNLVDRQEWEIAMGPGGALEAALEAKEQGKVRFIGVTGHGSSVARRHIESLKQFPFDSVLLPYNFPMMSQPDYAADFEELMSLCEDRDVAVQTIKSVARRRWQTAPERRHSWYEPLTDPSAVRSAVHWVLQRRGIFLNTSSDSSLLRMALDAASEPLEEQSTPTMATLVGDLEMEPLFEPGADAI